MESGGEDQKDTLFRRQVIQSLTLIRRDRMNRDQGSRIKVVDSFEFINDLKRKVLYMNLCMMRVK